MRNSKGLTMNSGYETQIFIKEKWAVKMVAIQLFKLYFCP